MQRDAGAVLPGVRLSVGTKFTLAVGVLIAALLAVAATGWSGLARSDRQMDHLYTDSVQALVMGFELVDVLHAAEGTALQIVPATDARTLLRLERELDEQLTEAGQVAAALQPLVADDDGADVVLADVRTGLVRFASMRRTDPLVTAGTDAEAVQRRARMAGQVSAVFTPLTHAADDLFSDEQQEAAAWRVAADRDQSATRRLLAGIVGLSLVAGVVIAALLRQDVVPRIRRCADFATAIAAGRPATPIRVDGGDELAELGTALNAMVEQRGVVQRQEHGQMDFVDTLQMTNSEDEAHELIKRHTERSLPGTAVTVLQTSNSANRLLAATALPPDSDLPARLAGAEPRSCLAVRFARTHQERPGTPALLDCGVCGGRDRPSTCEPLLVGGAVIGAVLVEDTDVPAAASGTGTGTGTDDHRIRTTVAQAAPVLANLRNLAVAEFRANNDSLTGLPNRRATDDTIKRFVAQANRSMTPLSAIMIDLDHFKQINDRFGHASGDDVLAAVGAALTSCLRETDFAGRFGGEEFLVLLPDTGTEDAVLVAEKVRATVSGIRVPGVEHVITASAGIADLLAHGGTAASMLREADRALYTAKAGGRDRTVVAGLDQPALTAQR